MTYEKIDDVAGKIIEPQEPKETLTTINDLVVERTKLITAIGEINEQYTAQITDLKTRLAETDKNISELKKLGIVESTEVPVEEIPK